MSATMTHEKGGDAQLDRPLNGLRAVEFVNGPMALAGRLLADLGADVVRVVCEGDRRTKGRERTLDGVSLDALAMNRGKRVVVLNPGDPADLARFQSLVGASDILIENGSQDAVLAKFVDVLGLKERHPELTILSITDFGRGGPYGAWAATDPVLHALSGELSRSGVPGRAPLLPPGRLATCCAAAQASFVVLLAYWGRLATGRGDWLDFSILEGVVQTLDPGFGIAGSAAAGARGTDLPRGRPEARHQYPIIPCADGFVRICILAARQWRGMFEWMGRPAEFSDPSFDLIATRFQSSALIPAIARFFADKARADLEMEGQRYGVPIAMVLEPGEATDTPQNMARETFVPVGVTTAVEVRLPQSPIEIDSRRLTARPPVQPSLGVRSTAPVDRGEQDAGPQRPLAGLRVLDLGVIVVGGETGRLFADAGADVIKVENTIFPDGSRQTRDGDLMSPSFAAGHRNKRSLVLNLRDPEGKALFLRLIAKSDVLLSNFKPGTLEALGFDQETLRLANPRLIAVDSSAFGPTGPLSRRLGYGPLVRAATGVTSVWSYPDETASFSDAATVYPDHVAARLGAATALALLIRRERTKAGGLGSLAQAEVILDHLAVEIAASELIGAGHVVEGVEPDAPWGVFPCSGDDQWCVVTVRGDEDWRRLAILIGLADDISLTGRRGRVGQRARVDQVLTNWLADRSPEEAMDALQGVGVPAGAMLRVSQMPDFPYFRDRDFFRSVEHPAIIAPFILEARPVRSRNMADPDQRPAPLMGEHSVEVLQEWLGLSKATIDGLIERDVVDVSTKRPAVARPS